MKYNILLLFLFLFSCSPKEKKEIVVEKIDSSNYKLTLTKPTDIEVPESQTVTKSTLEDSSYLIIKDKKNYAEVTLLHSKKRCYNSQELDLFLSKIKKNIPSDKITIILCDNKNLDTSSYIIKALQKINCDGWNIRVE
jgi:hypothetical protein